MAGAPTGTSTGTGVVRATATANTAASAASGDASTPTTIGFHGMPEQRRLVIEGSDPESFGYLSIIAEHESGALSYRDGQSVRSPKWRGRVATAGSRGGAGDHAAGDAPGDPRGAAAAPEANVVVPPAGGRGSRRPARRGPLPRRRLPKAHAAPQDH